MRGQPQWGAHLADELTKLLQIHDPSTVAAVIVELVTGSGGVLPPPVGYLERLRSICDQHGILLIFDEVITGFGRLGAAFGANAFGVTPDLITCAKGMTNATVPMGGVIVSGKIYETMMSGPESAVELFHGYTYSAHPLACAAALATLDVFIRISTCSAAHATSPPNGKTPPTRSRMRRMSSTSETSDCWGRSTCARARMRRARAAPNAPTAAMKTAS